LTWINKALIISSGIVLFAWGIVVCPNKDKREDN